MGAPVEPTLLIPMKTPLSQTILNSWTLPEKPKHTLSVASLLQTQREHGREVGMILDLSNHALLYGEDLVDGVQYEHIPVSAHTPVHATLHMAVLGAASCAALHAAATMQAIHDTILLSGGALDLICTPLDIFKQRAACCIVRAGPLRSLHPGNQHMASAAQWRSLSIDTRPPT